MERDTDISQIWTQTVDEMINRQTDGKRERDISQIWTQTGSKLIRDDKQR